VTEPATRADLARLERKMESIDQRGTRGVAVLAVQVQELAKDVARLELSIESHRGEHQAEMRIRTSSRRWVVGMVVAAIAAVDGPLITVLLAHGSHP